MKRLCPQSDARAYVDCGVRQPMLRKARAGEVSTCTECGRPLTVNVPGMTSRHFRESA